MTFGRDQGFAMCVQIRLVNPFHLKLTWVFAFDAQTHRVLYLS
jgi:hypothetical protein